MATSKSEIIDKFRLFSGNTGGIEGWLNENTDDYIIDRLVRIDQEPLSRAHLNQLFLLAHEAGLSEGFFKFYWLFVPAPGAHPYDITNLPDFDPNWKDAMAIISLDHLYWGFYRLYIDALLFFGNVRQAYRTFRTQSQTEIQNFFLSKTFQMDSLAGRSDRGLAMPINRIPRDDRYLIAEMACKSYEPADDAIDDMLSHLIAEFGEFKKAGGTKAMIKNLLEGNYTNKNKDRQGEFSFSAVEFLDEEISDVSELKEKYKRYYDKFKKARKLALRNTELYLSMINDLDVYVATSMRDRDDFRKMADNCETIFGHEDVKDLNIRYFDPTLSAAPGHEDKGLIECLMVKCAKVLIYMAGDKESYGKDAEAAMALSLGKPVIFYCDEDRRSRFYRDVHPLSRLVHFETGVAVGALVTSNLLDVPKILKRIFGNAMEYELVQEKEHYLQLRERLTQSIVRVQTNNILLRETFWNHYHNPI